MKNLKKIPKFKSEEEERNFWLKADSTKYIDYSKFERVVFPNLKPSTSPITIRLPDFLLNQVKTKAHILDVPYQSFIKQLISKGLDTSI